MSKFILFLISIFLFWSSTTFAEEKHPQMKVELPADLVNQLSQRFPGFQIAQRKDYCAAIEQKVLPFVGTPYRWSYGIVATDFNGDGHRDYSLIIRYKKRYLWLAALTHFKKNGKGYEIKVFGPPLMKSWEYPEAKINQRKVLKNKICEVILLVGEDAWQVAGKPKSNPYPYVGIENDGFARRFYWKDGRWFETGHEP